VKRLENGRVVYTGNRTHEKSLMLKSGMKTGEGGKLMLEDYNRYMNVQKKKAGKHLMHVYRKKDHMYMRLGVSGNNTLRHGFRDRNAGLE